MRLALYQPDIAANAGTMIRLGACLGVPVDVIEPCGFPFGDRAMKRAGMDYLEIANVTRHDDWAGFEAGRCGRLILLTTKGDIPYTEFAFAPGDILMVGRESAGAPEEVHAAAAARVIIPMDGPARSLNVAIAAAMVLGEAVRQVRSG